MIVQRIFQLLSTFLGGYEAWRIASHTVRPKGQGRTACRGCDLGEVMEAEVASEFLINKES